MLCYGYGINGDRALLVEAKNTSLFVMIIQVVFFIYIGITQTIADNDLSQLDHLMRSFLGTVK